jgi:glycosyltransferase involved in cell wall biosynthesis
LVSELIRGLAAAHEITLVSAESAESAKKSSVGHLLAGHIRCNPAGVSIAESHRLAAALAHSGVQIAHFHSGGNYGWGSRIFWQSPVIRAARLGVPCVTTNHGAFSITDGYCGAHRKFLKLALFLPAWLSKQIVLAHVRCEVTVSRHDFRAVRRWYPLMRGKFRQIYHSRIHASAPGPAPEVARRKIILCLGTIGPRKGQAVLTRAFAQIAARHPDWQLWLVGRPDNPEIVRQVQETIRQHKLEDRVQMPGECSDAEMERWFKTAVIFAMPSFHEGLGLSLQEALFHGCACVGSRAGGIPDLIQDGDNGLLVEAGDTAQLAGALEKLMSDEKLRARFGARATESVLKKGMTAEIMVQRYLELYETVLRKI